MARSFFYWARSLLGKVSHFLLGKVIFLLGKVITGQGHFFWARLLLGKVIISGKGNFLLGKVIFLVGKVIFLLGKVAP